MKTIVSLEKSIHALIKTSCKLREERDRNFKVAENVRNELHEAKETIKELQLNMERMKKTNHSNNELETRKKEIIFTAQSIISKLDKINNIDIITNDQS